MLEEDFFCLVDYPLYLAVGHAHLFSEPFVSDTINEPSFKNDSVLLVVDVFVNQRGDLTVRVVFHLILILPVPLHMLQRL